MQTFRWKGQWLFYRLNFILRHPNFTMALSIHLFRSVCLWKQANWDTQLLRSNRGKWVNIAGFYLQAVYGLPTIGLFICCNILLLRAHIPLLSCRHTIGLSVISCSRHLIPFYFSHRTQPSCTMAIESHKTYRGPMPIWTQPFVNRDCRANQVSRCYDNNCGKVLSPGFTMPTFIKMTKIRHWWKNLAPLYS